MARTPPSFRPDGSPKAYLAWLEANAGQLSGAELELQLLPSFRHLWRRFQAREELWPSIVPAKHLESVEKMAADMGKKRKKSSGTPSELAALAEMESELQRRIRRAFVASLGRLIDTKVIAPLPLRSPSMLSYQALADLQGEGPTPEHCICLPPRPERMLKRRKKRTPLTPPGSISLYQAKGYYRAKLDGKSASDLIYSEALWELVHRITLWRAQGPRADWEGKGCPFARRVAMHSCNNPACINPGHLQWGTYQMNYPEQLRKAKP
jgi:hypothetical protein